MVITPISQMRNVRPREGLGCVQVTQGWGHLSGRTQRAMPMTQRDTGDEGRGAGGALGAWQDVGPGVQDGGVPEGARGQGSGRRAPPLWVVSMRKLRQIPPLGETRPVSLPNFCPWAPHPSHLGGLWVR